MKTLYSVCILLSALSAVSYSQGNLGGYRIVCYFGDWAIFRPGMENRMLDPYYCTVVVYAFEDVNTVIFYDGNNTIDPMILVRARYRELSAVTVLNPNMQALVAVGGYNRGSASFYQMASTAQTRQNFIQRCLTFVLNVGLDGLVLQWEFPARGDSVHGSDDVENFNQLLREFRSVFDRNNLTLSAAVAPLERDASLSYDVATISEYLDFVHVMTYNLHGPWENETGHNAALSRGEGYENVPRQNLSTVDVAIEYWLRSGCPPEKLILGVSFLGHSFTLANPAVNGVRAPSTGAGIAGPITQTAGTLAYREICVLLRNQTWNVTNDVAAQVPYASRGNNWLSFDNAASIRAKVAYARSLNLTGIMAWSVESDDVTNVCGGGTLPLLNAVNGY